MRNVFVADPLLLIFAALALIDNNIAMAVLVYKRIAAQPFQVALTQAEELVQFCWFTTVTTTFARAALELAGCTNWFANVFDCDACGLADWYEIVMNGGCRFALGFKLLFVALDFVLSNFA